MFRLFEFKARSNCNEELEQKLLQLDARFAGEDHQTDTYFNVPYGRLKLREGQIGKMHLFIITVKTLWGLNPLT